MIEALNINSVSGNGVNLEKRKIEVVKILIIKILIYSAIKIKANIPLLYSILNPETSSDSPSAKSNGVRFVSARVVINQQKKIGGITRIRGRCSFVYISEKLNNIK